MDSAPDAEASGLIAVLRRLASGAFSSRPDIAYSRLAGPVGRATSGWSCEDQELEAGYLRRTHPSQRPHQEPGVRQRSRCAQAAERGRTAWVSLLQRVSVQRHRTKAPPATKPAHHTGRDRTPWRRQPCPCTVTCHLPVRLHCHLTGDTCRHRRPIVSRS